MPQPAFLRWTGIALMGGGLLTILINVGMTPFLPQHASLEVTAASSIFPWRQGASGVAVILTLLGSVGLYAWQAEKAGKFGAAAFVVAFTGTALALCIEWTETFLVRDLAATAPEALHALDTRHGLGLYDLGALISLGIFALGWIMLAASTLRLGLARWGAWILIAGFFLNPILGGITHGNLVALIVGACIPGIGWLLLGNDLRRAVSP
ncbi:MAG: hypothetical protein ACHQAZ_03925 [Gammaproteobacteria bacterium]